MTSSATLMPRISDSDLDALLQGLGQRYEPSDMDELWPVPDLICPGITCVTGQPEKGKTTLLISLVEALLSGSDWFSRPTNLLPDSRIVYFCEDRNTASRVQRACGQSGRVYVVTLQTWHQGASLVNLVDRTGAGLVIIDSLYPAVDDVNDQSRSGVFLSALQSVSVPIIVVHHEAKGGKSGPLGVQRFAAAYRQTIKVKTATPEADGWLGLDLHVTGNDVVPQRYAVRVNRDSRAAELVAEDGGDRFDRRRKRRLSKGEKASALGVLANEAELAPELNHNEIASALLGGARGHEDRAKQIAVASALGIAAGTVGHQAVANLIRDNPTEFKAGQMLSSDHVA